MLHKMIVLVGPSRSGKTTLMLRARESSASSLEILKSVTTRPFRDTTDPIIYDRLSEEEFLGRVECGQIVLPTQYGGNWYDTDQVALDTILQNRHALYAMTADAVEKLREFGYDLFVVKVIPHHRLAAYDDARKKDDVRLEHEKIHADGTVHTFTRGGKKRTLMDFLMLLSSHGLITPS